MDYAISRAWTRRKRRKPPPRSFWIALAIFLLYCWDLLIGVQAIMNDGRSSLTLFDRGKHYPIWTWMLGIAVWSVWIIVFAWPRLKEEINRWRKDDDDL